MAPRKRKVVVAAPVPSPEKVKFSTAVMQTMLNAQAKETTHPKLINQLKRLYTSVPHDSFMKSFLQVIKRQMQHEETNEYANNVLKFCAKFVAEPEYSEQSVTHPVMESIFNWLLSTISGAPLVRFRICQLVNLILNALGSDATLDDTICDKILRYMLERMRDVSQQVRVQAVLALQRLQDPSSPEDTVVRAYTYHLDKDPSAKVRQTIITCLGRNYRSIPNILERLWDVDDRVRRHTYMQMSSFPVRQYKVAQRLKFLEQGLSDHSESVRKVVRNVMIPQWVESYQRDCVAFVEALKLDADEQEMDRFRKTSKMALSEIFSKNGVKEMTEILQFSEENRTVALDQLTIERAICWQAMLEHIQKTKPDELEDYMPELSKFCEYLKLLVENPGMAAFVKCTNSNTTNISNQTSPGQPDGMDKLQQLYYQYILLTLLEIVTMYDFGDVFGCDSLKLVLSGILCSETLNEMNVKSIMQTFEKLLPDVETRLKFFVDLVNSILEPSRQDVSNSSRVLVESYLEQHPEQTALKMKISSLRLKILDLKEQETLLVQKKDYAGAQCVSEKLNQCNEEYANLVKPLLQEMTTSISNTTGESSSTLVFRDSILKPKRMTQATIIKCLQVCFYLVNSTTVRGLDPTVCDLYKSFISRYVQSAQLHTRNWALRASTAFSMLYDGLSKDTFQLLYQQFLDTASTRLWKTAIEGVFELLDRYGFEHFDLDKDDTAKDDSSRTNKSSRQLFNRHSVGYPDDLSSSTTCNGNEFYKMSIHFMDTCDDNVICSTIIEGFCRLILHGHCTSPDIVSKLLLRFFNPTTDPETQQVLGIFFEAMIRKKRQELLQKALLRTLFAVLEAPNESPLAEVHPETVVKFVINSTQPIFCSPGVNPHNAIAVTFLRVVHDNLTLKDLLRILSNQLLVLDITEDPALRGDLASAVNGILQESNLDPKIVKKLSTFREMMLGKIREPLSFSSSRAPTTLTTSATELGEEAIESPSTEKEPREAEQDDDDDELREEEEEEDEDVEVDRSSDRPKINKSILQEDSDADLLASPMKAADVPNTPSSPVPMTTPPQLERSESSMKSLRRSLCFGSCPPPKGPPKTSTIPAPSSEGTFKVPDAPALRKIRGRTKEPSTSSAMKDRTMQQAQKEKDREQVEEFEIPATQEAEDDHSSGNSHETDSDSEIPETQSTPLTTGRKKSITGRTSARRNASAAGKRSDSTSSSSTSESTSDGEVVNGSPNVTVSRIDRSARPLNKVAAKTLYERSIATPGTMPRITRHVSRQQTINGKVMTRKSLSAFGAASPKLPASEGERKSRARQSNAKTPSHQTAKKPTKTAEKVSTPDRPSRASTSRRSKNVDEQSPSPSASASKTHSTTTNVPSGTPSSSLPKTPTRTSARGGNVGSNVAQPAAVSSPGKRFRDRKPPATDANSSTDSGTSTSSPIRLKRAAVVLTPLSVASHRHSKHREGITGAITSTSTPIQTTSPRSRPSRKSVSRK
ncbi:condensin complex subunit 3 [Anopheles ziemanni]|uniref:condensin complex subunit 3 n=1 Tax=Anopheles coustani TaxID=139045 RepID=UPI00265A6A42|nr:condensin complex subunit 3 [Anopheles coustani]XP_058166785.1 condensin complex subunit 3 [Anopheles ziemanni]